MTTIYADFNALTEARSIRLTTKGSQEDIQRFGVKPGDRVWLTDGESRLEALVIEDERYGLIGRPSWQTMVDLDADPSPISQGTIS